MSRGELLTLDDYLRQRSLDTRDTTRDDLFVEYYREERKPQPFLKFESMFCVPRGTGDLHEE